MRIVVTHTDFRLYWPARLHALQKIARANGASMQVVEIAGKGSPYSFAGHDQDPQDGWQCLFPGRAMEDVPPRLAGATLCAVLDTLRPDVILAGPIAFPSGATAVRWCTLNGRSCVVFDDARYDDVRRSRVTNFIKRVIYRNVQAVLIPAPSHTSSFQRWGFKADSIFFGLDAVDNAFFRERASLIRLSEAAARSRLRLPRKFFLSVGRQIPIKQLHVLIEAYGRYARQTAAPVWSLVLVGNGVERLSLETSVARDMKANICFIDFLRQDDLAACYALAGALVLPSLSETWGLVVNEGMAAGLPVIVSRGCGCAATLVREGTNGWTCDPHSIQDLAEKLSLMAASTDEQLSRFGKTSQAIVSQWGLDRFTRGAWDAIWYATRQHKNSTHLFDSLILNLWHGRYRPL